MMMIMKKKKKKKGPDQIKLTENVNLFKNYWKSNVFKHFFYSVHEFISF
jgi:hypothetical protein